MAITRDQLAYDLRISTGEAIPDDDPEAASLDRSLGASLAIVDATAGETAPAAIRDQATIMIAKYLHDAPTSERTNYAFPARNSGALALLAPWRRHRAVGFGGESDAPGGGGISVDEVQALIAAALAGIVTVPALPVAGDVPLDYRLQVAADGVVSWDVVVGGAAPSGGALTVTEICTWDGTSITLADDAPSEYAIHDTVLNRLTWTWPTDRAVLGYLGRVRTQSLTLRILKEATGFMISSAVVSNVYVGASSALSIDPRVPSMDLKTVDELLVTKISEVSV